MRLALPRPRPRARSGGGCRLSQPGSRPGPGRLAARRPRKTATPRPSPIAWPTTSRATAAWTRRRRRPPCGATLPPTRASASRSTTWRSRGGRTRRRTWASASSSTDRPAASAGSTGSCPPSAVERFDLRLVAARVGLEGGGGEWRPIEPIVSPLALDGRAALLLGGDELQGRRVHAVAQAGRLRPVVEDVAEVASATRAHDFGPAHEERIVGVLRPRPSSRAAPRSSASPCRTRTSSRS